DGKRFFVEPLTGLPRVLIFGSGHIAQQLAMLTVLAAFKTTVLDDRRDYTVRNRFPLVDEIVLLDTYALPLEGISIDADSYIVILTRNQTLDRQVLDAALTTGAAYIGMIGSERKCRAIRDNLAQSGAAPEAVTRLHAPIGLAIGAETPEEVAISITAELIRERARM
ncbi:MAG: XdhC/CoxF family protein, partial [Deltaproteobacteria bacterium]|nr:XdhC/CoxF family protein [Deltaproteobacteria bacterium]